MGLVDEDDRRSNDSLSQTPSQRRRGGGSTTGSGIRMNKYRYSSNSLTREQRRQRLLDYGTGGHGVSGEDGAGAASSTTPRNAKHRFEITRKLGSGTYGKVSLAYDHKMEREVAVKLIKKSAIENKQDLLRIRREIRIMSALSHPYIIQIYEVFENREKIIIIMEYSSKGEVYDYVSQFGSLPEPEARRLFRQITSAVLYCHRHGVVHRDLKLENILLDKDNCAKIADFGLSNYFSKSKLLNTFCGSPLYASPEIINGTPYKGPEVDCWSLGVLLYTLVYGSMPFDGRDFNRMVRQIKRGAYYEPDTPSTASMLIRNMLRVSPEKRANIDDIAGHWWLNLDENLPMILELPENQILDPTPLNERAQTMVVQDLADETDVFMEFGHMSAATRNKIEEFRRRRKEAEQYITECPIGPKRGKVGENKEWKLADASSQDTEDVPKTPPAVASKGQPPTAAAKTQVATTAAIEVDNHHHQPAEEQPREKTPSLLDDPLERLRNLEQRLTDAVDGAGSRRERGRTTHATPQPPEVSPPPPPPPPTQQEQQPMETETMETTSSSSPPPFSRTGLNRPLTLVEPQAQPAPPPQAAESSVQSRRPPSFVPTVVDDPTPPRRVTPTTAVADDRTPHRFEPETTTQPRWKVESDMLNMYMNQLLEQTEKGQISMNLVNRIKTSPGYYTRPLCKELLEAILLVQKPTDETATTPEFKPVASTSTTPVATTPVVEEEEEVDEDDEPVIERMIGKEMIVIPIEPPSPSASDGGGVVDRKASTDVGPSAAGDETEEEDEEVDDTSDYEDLGSDLEESSTTEVNETVLAMTAENKKSLELLPTISPKHETKSQDKEEEESEEEEEEEEEDDSYKSVQSTTMEDVDGKPPARHPPDPSTPASAPAFFGKESVDENAGPLQPKISLHSEAKPKDKTLHRRFTIGSTGRGLIKRMSRGKYMCHIDVYHRGVSLDDETTRQNKRRIGGTQPVAQDAPKLFEKAKEYILDYPNVLASPQTQQPVKEPSPFSRKMNWLKSQDPDLVASASSQEGGGSGRGVSPRDRSVSYEQPSNQTSEMEPVANDAENRVASEKVKEVENAILTEKIAEDTVNVSPAPAAGLSIDTSATKFVLQAPPRSRKSPATPLTAESSRQSVQTPTSLFVDVAAAAKIDSPGTRQDRKPSPPQVFTFTKATTKSPSPPSRSSRERGASTVVENDDSASTAIRRRLRDRRRRNRTIGDDTDGNVDTAAATFQRNATAHSDMVVEQRRDQPNDDDSTLDALLSPRLLPSYSNKSSSPSNDASSRVKKNNAASTYSDAKDYDAGRYRSSAYAANAVNATSIGRKATALKDEATRNSSSSSARADNSSTSVSPTASSGGNKLGDPFYSHYTKYGAPSRYQPGSALNYVRPRYNNETYRSGAVDTATRVAHRPSLDQRRKSRSLHELSPGSDAASGTDTDRQSEAQTQTTATVTGRRYPVYQPRYSTSASRPTATTLFDKDPYTSRHTDTTDPSHRYSAGYGGAGLRDTTTTDYRDTTDVGGVGRYYGAGASTNNRTPSNYQPASVYEPYSSAYQRPIGASGTGAASYYRSKYDSDNVTYRRGHYDVETKEDAGPKPLPPQYQPSSHVAHPPNSHQTRLRAGEARRWMRSQSLDKKFARDDSFEDRSEIGRGRMVTPEIASTDYGYVTYHDTGGGGGGSSTASPSTYVRGDMLAASHQQPAKSILKKISNGHDPTAHTPIVTSTGANAGVHSSVGGAVAEKRYEPSSRSPSRFKPMQIVDRLLRRHLSSEKSPSPTPLTSAGAGNSRYYSSGGAYGYGASSGHGSANSDRKSADSSAEKSARKKRSLLNMGGRRRTMEVDGGASGGAADRPAVDMSSYSSGGESSALSRRPSSPLEKIKGFFRKSKENISQTTARGDSPPTASSRYTSSSRTPYTSSIYAGAGAYKKAYEPTPSSYRPLSTYVPSGTRRWHDDAPLY